MSSELNAHQNLCVHFSIGALQTESFSDLGFHKCSVIYGRNVSWPIWASIAFLSRANSNENAINPLFVFTAQS